MNTLYLLQLFHTQIILFLHFIYFILQNAILSFILKKQKYKTIMKKKTQQNGECNNANKVNEIEENRSNSLSRVNANVGGDDCERMERVK